MYQTFETSTDGAHAAERLTALRQELKNQSLDAFIIPRSDEHQGEYVQACSERLKWLTGFSGSAGLAVVTARTAAIFVDGRYDVQVRLQTDETLFDYPGLPSKHLAEWLSNVLKLNAVVGFDPWLMTIAEHQRLTKALAQDGIKLKPVGRNLVDRIWGKEKPPPVTAPLTLHPLKYAGRKPKDKIADVQAALKAAGSDFAVLTAPDSICWLLNVRGHDIPHTPVALAFAIVGQKGKPELFIAPEKLSPAVRDHLKTLVKLQKPETLKSRLKTLKAAMKIGRLDPASAAFWFQRILGAAGYAPGRDPCLTLKAIKTSAEIRGARAAHQRDGVAMVRFLSWLAQNAGKGQLDEIGVVKHLEAMRAEAPELKDISFETIAGSGPNGAIVHYRVDEHTNRRIQSGELLLVDSGGQYSDGTTDITRTVAVGKPTEDMRRNFTLVLKGMIAISTSRFPNGTRGVDLDPFARRALWQHGLDYGHGTGHGVGSFLSVHEGPQSLSRAGMVALEPGMILSNEPGYYKQGCYGIRIENLVLVTPGVVPKGGDSPMMGFETLTLAPIDRTLIDVALLNTEERAWLNAYHHVVHETLSPDLPAPDAAWLKTATKPL
jgi:Xaa-Pro aminopeptidase